MDSRHPASRPRRGLALLPAVPALITLCGLGPGPEPRYVFVTSVTGTAALGTWPDAGGETGAAAGDAICAARATAAGLPDPTSYVAWISTSTDDAYCRIHGLSGKAADLCGQASLPATAGPWRRTDGQPFARGIGELASGAVLTPPRLDEFGDAVASSIYLVTATFADGALNTLHGTCSDWTSPAAFTRVGTGSTEWTTTGWTQRTYSDCGLIHNRLICVGTGPATPLTMAPPASGRLAFVTADVGTGDLASWPGSGGELGVAAGDAICRDRATQAGLPHSDSYKAWLGAQRAQPQERFDHDGPWYRPDGVLAAENLAALSTPLLSAPTNLTATGATFLGLSELVWSGFGCSDWTYGGFNDNGTFGRPGASNYEWSNSSLVVCENLNHLYCLADVPWEIFRDGFESGDTTLWSSASP